MILELLSLAGFLISSYIFVTVHNHKQLICPLGKDCNAVVESKYGELFGIRNDMLGMFYYATVFIFSFFMIPIPHTLALFVTGGASAMALLLIFIQAFVLKKWCDFCLGSSVVTFAIFLTVLLA